MFWCNWNFQTFIQELNRRLESLNDLVLLWITVVLGVVILFGYSLLMRENRSVSLESEIMESFWTFMPIIILISIVLPRCSLLNREDSFLNFEPDTTFKLTRFQWNWQRENNEEIFHTFDVGGILYLYSLEEPIITKNILARFVLSRGDVLHSLGLPSLGVKLDAIPGRLNSFRISTSCLGLIAGSCYELCGAGHSVMPLSWLIL